MTKILIAFVAMFSLLALACHPGTDYQSDCPTGGRKHLIDLVNNWRANHNSGYTNANDLVFCNSYANSKAQAWAQVIADANSGSHSTLENGYPSSSQWGHRYWCWLGEDVGINSGSFEFRNAVLENIFNQWIASDSHRAVIAETAAQWIGTGAVWQNNRWYAVLEMGTIGPDGSQNSLCDHTSSI